MIRRIAVVGVAVSLGLLVAVSGAGCSAGTPVAGTDIVGNGEAGTEAGTKEAGAGSDASAKDAATPDAEDLVCSFAKLGHPGAMVIQPRPLNYPDSGEGHVAGCQASDRILTKAEYKTLLASKADGGAQGGADAGADIDDSSEVVLLIKGPSSYSISAGLDSGAIVILATTLCQGVAPRCEEQAYAVPKASSVTRLACPVSKEPCLAP